MRNNASRRCRAAGDRAATARLQAEAKDPDAARLTKEDADTAMTWLQQAVAAGFPDAARMRTDGPLYPSHRREDFQKLLAGLEARSLPNREVAPPREKT